MTMHPSFVKFAFDKIQKCHNFAAGVNEKKRNSTVCVQFWTNWNRDGFRANLKEGQLVAEALKRFQKLLMRGR